MFLGCMDGKLLKFTISLLKSDVLTCQFLDSLGTLMNDVCSRHRLAKASLLIPLKGLPSQVLHNSNNADGRVENHCLHPQRERDSVLGELHSILGRVGPG
jgi:hypothetical protein